MIIHGMNITFHGIAPLPHLGVIRVEGEDAAKFLHGQLTQDFALLGLTEARLAAFCNAKGRMQASFIGLKRSPTDILLVCSRDLLASTLKRLSMFVLRAKAKLSDASGDFVLLGLAGDTATALTGGDRLAWTKTEVGAASLVTLYPADGVARALWLAPVGEAPPPGIAMDPATWLWMEVRSGVASVTPPIAEAFVPQMLNFESVGGVNFKKGCYPGQEVVARSQFRGTLKRRAYLVHADHPLAAGHDIFQDADLSQPCGSVAQAAASPHGGFDAIASLQVAAAAAGSLSLGPGKAISLLPLPYPLLDDI
jgi:folate-binding protein YgfZ